MKNGGLKMELEIKTENQKKKYESFKEPREATNHS